MAGTLSGVIVRRDQDIKQSQFNKLILKGILRDTVKNIITFDKLGIDSKIISINNDSYGSQTVPFSH